MCRFLLHSNPFRPGHETNTRADHSTGCSRRASGHVHQIDGCVVVPIMDGAAAITRPFPIRERQAGVHVTAIAAGLAGRIPAISDDDTSARHRGLIFRLPPELEGTDVRDGKSKAVVRHHAVHVQVFDADHIEPPHDLVML